MCGVNDREAFCEEAMTDESRKRLTEYLEGCRHDWRFPYTGSDMGCFKCKQFKSTVTDRTFTTGNDMLDLLAKLHENGKLSSFLIWLQDEHGYDWLGWEADSVETRVSHIDNYIKIMRKEISNGRSITQQT